VHAETLLSPFLQQPIVWFSVTLAIITAWLMGFSRSGIGAGGFVVSPMMVLALGASDGLAIIAVLMIPAGVVGSWQYRKNTDWKMQSALIPGAFVGTAIGGIILWSLIVSGEESVVQRRMEYVVASLSLLYVALVSFRERIVRIGGGGGPALFPGIFGIGSIIGLSQTVANSGAPLMTLYFLRHGLKKDQYVAAQNLFLLVQNVIKLVPFIALGILHLNNAGAAILLFPLTLLGSWVGRKFSAVSSEKTFFALYVTLLIIGFVSSVILIWGRGNFFRLFGA
jgi:uncharacterized membrane protein YfcA